MESVAYIILAITTVAIAWVLTVVLRRPAVAEEVEPEPTNKSNDDAKSGKKQASTGDGKKATGKSKSKGGQQQQKEKFSHPWLISTLKGHSGKVLGMDLSPNNKFLATCAEDRTIYLWFTKDFADKDHKSIRVNIPFDHATLVRWSPDSKAFVVARNDEKMLEVYKLGRKADNSIGNIQSAMQWSQNADSPVEYTGLGIACSGKFLMSCTSNSCIVLREPKGAMLKTLVAPLNETELAKVSPCGRYIALTGGDLVVVYEVTFDSITGQFKDCILKWKMKTEPASASTTGLDFNTDSSKIATVNNRGAWNLFNTTGSRVNVETKGKVDDDISGSKPVIAISGDSRVVLVGAADSIYIFSAFSGDLLDKISNVCKEDITGVAVTADCKYLLSSGDNVIHVFNNVSWYKETIKNLKNQLQDSSVTGAMRNRMMSELAAFEQELRDKGLATNFS